MSPGKTPCCCHSCYSSLLSFPVSFIIFYHCSHADKTGKGSTAVFLLQVFFGLKAAAGERCLQDRLEFISSLCISSADKSVPQTFFSPPFSLHSFLLSVSLFICPDIHPPPRLVHVSPVEQAADSTVINIEDRRKRSSKEREAQSGTNERNHSCRGLTLTSR